MKIDVGQAEMVTLQVDSVSVSRSAAQGMVFVSLGGHTLGLTEKQAGIVGRWLVELTQEEPPERRAGWIKWDGGPCPVKVRAGVEVEHRNGMRDHGPAIKFDWLRASVASDYDIVAYRVVP
jgi:hypothetical protein